MPDGTQFQFADFRLDPANAQLWCGKQECKLKPKAFAVLHYLVEHAGQLVTKEELWQAVWPAVVVTEGVLTTCLTEIRQALGDKATTPRFIETVHRRGYRFIAPLTAAPAVHRAPPQPPPGLQLPPLPLVGREAELARLESLLDTARHGVRQVVFVTGEAGIGKTAVVEAFARRLLTKGEVWVTQGQCLEHFGTGEAYLPILAAVGQLAREPGHEAVGAILHQHAPTWLVQLPALATAADLERLQRTTQGATRERMLRELAEALEAVTAHQLLVVVLEDLHWSDYATLDLLSYVARRRQPARLLVLGTYRPVEVILRGHPLHGVKQDLQGHRLCAELAVGFLSAAAVAGYLAQRFPGAAPQHVPLQHLAQAIHQRTDGNALFMINVVDYLVARGVISQREGAWEVQPAAPTLAQSLPEGLRQIIELQLDRLPLAEQRLLAVASVAGAEFSAALVAAGGEQDIDGVETFCEALVRRGQFLRAQGTEEWPDGTLAGRYGFHHALYQEVLYTRLTARQQRRLHHRLGERKEHAYGARAQEIAAELAMHFERGRDYPRAVHYYEQAAQTAIRRSAQQEAIEHLRQGLALLPLLPDTPARAQQELRLQTTLGGRLLTTKGYGAPAAAQAYARAWELCQQVEETPDLFPVLWGLSSFYAMRDEQPRAEAIGEQMWQLAQRTQDPAHLLIVHRAWGSGLFWRGEVLAARDHLERGVALYDRHQHHVLAFRYVTDPGVHCLGYLASTLGLLGYPDQALQRVQEALALAEELAHPLSVVYARAWAWGVHRGRGEVEAARAQAEAVVTLATAQGFAHFMAEGTIWRGWAVAAQGQASEGIVQIHQGLKLYQATGSELARPTHLATLAQAYALAGQVDEGLQVVAEALAAVRDKRGRHLAAAELYRLKGELLWQKGQGSGPPLPGQKRREGKVQRAKSKNSHPQPLASSTQAEVEECFLKAIEVARQQQTKSPELRAATGLARLWQHQGKTEAARRMLAELYGWFTEGFDTKDLQEAKALLEELS